tara:strand:+ start:32872 stop:33087 length:216 start_codon:yes stop_codon:yes gene_type:complete
MSRFFLCLIVSNLNSNNAESYEKAEKIWRSRKLESIWIAIQTECQKINFQGTVPLQTLQKVLEGKLTDTFQ